MAKVKVVSGGLDQNLNGTYFNNVPSETLFSFGDFQITTNSFGRTYIDYSNTLSSFVRVVTLDTMGVTETQSQNIYAQNTNVVLNLDKSNLNTFIRFGSAYEYLRVCVEKIITKYPASLFVSSRVVNGGNITYYDYNFDIGTNTTTFKVPVSAIINKFGLSYKDGSTEAPNNIELRNLNLSYNKYIVWTKYNLTGNTFSVVGFTGNTNSKNYITLKVDGNPFSIVTGTTTSALDFHIRPNNFEFEEFRSLLEEYEANIISSRDGVDGFKFTMKEPSLDDNGNIKYIDTDLLWNTSDGYNIDIDTTRYGRFLDALLTIGAKYDSVKTDLIARFLTPSSIKTYDLTDEGKMTKLLRLYGREFDQIREFIDSILYINKTTYNKIENIPDQLISNLSRTLGWNYFSLLNEDELVQSFLTVDDNERNLNENILPAEIDIELWRRIIINTNYFWKTKGTREAIKSIFLLIGIPEPFINISEYVYTVNGKINPNTVELVASDFPTNTLPFDSHGYPKAPLETSDFYFQISGNTDSGQEYMNVFRQAGFNLYRTVDNRKSWVESGATYRVDDTTPQYYQEDSRLVLNTKEVDVSLDTARGVEYDVFTYIQDDYKINSSGYTLPYSFVNISLGYTGTENTFPLPSNYDPDGVLGSLEVRLNGILLNGSDSGGTNTMVGTDYTVNSLTKTFTLTNANYANNNTYNRDVVQASFIYSGGTTTSVSGITVSYILTRISANMSGTAIPLPSVPAGDIQLTIDGIALTKGTNSYSGDYIVDIANQQIVIQNPTLIAYLIDNPNVQVAYVEVSGSTDIYARNEVLRVNSFNSSKLYFNLQANKYVYRLNYKTNDTSDIKFMIDGITLEPETDYSLNPQDPYEIFLPSGIKYGSVLSIYYLVGSNTIFNPIVSDVFGVGDISNISFLEFLELIQRRMINVRNRKTITDFKGGWYPSLLKIYIEYLKRSTLASDDPLLSNGYTFTNLYSFLGKYSTFFQRFVDELLSPTIILRKSGLLVRNNIFTKQKFAYRRGVNLCDVNNNGRDHRGRYMYEYLGKDNSLFKIKQPIILTDPSLFVNTVTATATSSSIVTGGDSVSSFDMLTSYGVQYRCYDNAWYPWTTEVVNGFLTCDSYSITINNLSPNTLYEYRAFTKLTPWGYTGVTKSITTLIDVPIPEVHTCIGTPTSNSIIGTGGFDIVGYENAEYYGMQYGCVGSLSSDIMLSSSCISVTSGSSSQVLTISGDSWNTYAVVKDPSLTWLNTSSPATLSPTGVNTDVLIQTNNGVARSGVLCYVPSIGTTKYLSVQQDSGALPVKPVYMTCATGGCQTATYELGCANLDTTSDMSAGECYSLSIGWSMSNAGYSQSMQHMLCVDCNGSTIYSCDIDTNNAKTCSGLFTPIIVRHGDSIKFTTESEAPSTSVTAPVLTSIYLNSVTNISGNFGIGATPTYMINLTSTTSSSS